LYYVVLLLIHAETSNFIVDIQLANVPSSSDSVMFHLLLPTLFDNYPAMLMLHHSNDGRVWFITPEVTSFTPGSRHSTNDQVPYT
jgi:hypothetical protein